MVALPLPLLNPGIGRVLSLVERRGEFYRFSWQEQYLAHSPFILATLT